MESQISDAILLLFVGMFTVFVILFLVTLSGNLLIKAINKFEEIKNLNDAIPKIPTKIIAISTAVVSEITEGKGIVEHIERK